MIVINSQNLFQSLALLAGNALQRQAGSLESWHSSLWNDHHQTGTTAFLADNLSGGIGHTVFHPFIPFSNVVKADVKAIDVFLPENLAEGLQCILSDS